MEGNGRDSSSMPNSLEESCGAAEYRVRVGVPGLDEAPNRSEDMPCKSENKLCKRYFRQVKNNASLWVVNGNKNSIE